MDKKYIIEYMGVLVIVTAKLLTEADPAVMAIVYFSIFWMAGKITSGYFTPFGPLAMYMLGRGALQDVVYNLIAQLTGAVSAILLFKPLKAYID
jgi:glycerol uptake facilitator-like aquaporin